MGVGGRGGRSRSTSGPVGPRPQVETVTFRGAGPALLDHSGISQVLPRMADRGSPLQCPVMTIRTRRGMAKSVSSFHGKEGRAR